MTYIIDPIWFYWLSVVDVCKDGAGALAVVFTIVTIAAAIILLSFWADGDNVEGAKKVLKFSFPMLVVFALAALFIPSRETLVTMKVAEFATYENAEIAIDSIQAAVDCIIDAIAQIGGEGE